MAASGLQCGCGRVDRDESGRESRGRGNTASRSPFYTPPPSLNVQPRSLAPSHGPQLTYVRAKLTPSLSPTEARTLSRTTSSASCTARLSLRVDALYYDSDAARAQRAARARAGERGARSCANGGSEAGSTEPNKSQGAERHRRRIPMRENGQKAARRQASDRERSRARRCGWRVHKIVEDAREARARRAEC